MLIAFTARLQGVPRVVPDRITNISLWECVTGEHSSAALFFIQIKPLYYIML